MPVLVTGAETGLGRAAVLALQRAGGEVRAYVDRDNPSREVLASSGAKVSSGTIDDEGRLELALEQVHTVVHCWGGPLTAPADEHDAAAGVLSAALGAGCRRIVWASHLGADAPQGNPYLVACAEVEALLGEAPLESVVIRRALTYGPGDAFTTALADGSGSAVRGDARHAPLALQDLVAAVVSADALERTRTAGDLAITMELAGPQTMTFREFAAALGRPRLRRAAPPLPPWTAALYSRDLVGGSATVGGRGTPIAEGISALRR